MTRLTYTPKLMLALALSALGVVALSLMAGGGLASSSTYAVLAALLIALAVIGFNTYRSVRATGSVGQLLYETEMAKPGGRTNVATSGAKRSDR